MVMDLMKRSMSDRTKEEIIDDLLDPSRYQYHCPTTVMDHIIAVFRDPVSIVMLVITIGGLLAINGFVDRSIDNAKTEITSAFQALEKD